MGGVVLRLVGHGGWWCGLVGERADVKEIWQIRRRMGMGRGKYPSYILKDGASVGGRNECVESGTNGAAAAVGRMPSVCSLMCVPFSVGVTVGYLRYLCGDGLRATDSCATTWSVVLCVG